MLIVADTNVLVSGILWRGLPHKLVELAEQHRLTLVLCRESMMELREVLARPQFAAKLSARGVTAAEIVLGITQLAVIYPLIPIDVISTDPDDNIFIGCALSAAARYIVSGDRHLLELSQYAGIAIVTVREFISREFPDCLK